MLETPRAGVHLHHGQVELLLELISLELNVPSQSVGTALRELGQRRLML